MHGSLTQFPSPLGRLLPKYRKFNDYMDQLYADAEANRATNGCKFTPHYPVTLTCFHLLILPSTQTWAARPTG